MAEIEFLLPTVQYGNVKVRATPEELGLPGVADAATLGTVAAVYLNAFQQGFKRGADIDVDIDDPTTDLSEHTTAVDQIRNDLGATVVEENDTSEVSDDGVNDAPWNKTPTAAVSKPWEQSAKPTEVASIEW